jgi:hypothetical protein
MSKAILLSIQSQHALNILNGDKTLELRKRVPKDFVGWVYVYVTKGKPILSKVYEQYKVDDEATYYSIETFQEILDKVQSHKSRISLDELNGLVIMRFWFDEYEEIEYETIDDYSGALEDVCMYNQRYEQIVKQSCLDYEIMEEYANGKDIYAWHIKKLEILKPMQLSEFYKDGFEQCEYSPFDYDNDLETCLDRFRIKRAPQSFQYVWVKE